MPKNNLQKSKELITLIENNNDQWEKYKALFTNLHNNFVNAFKDYAVHSSIVISSKDDLAKLKTFANTFIKPVTSLPDIHVNKETILTIDERLQVIDFLIQTGPVFKQSKLIELKQKLLKRKNKLSNIPSDSKIWFGNPIYFKKYPDHPAAISSITDLEVSRKIKFKEAYQLLIGLNKVKPFLNIKLSKIIEKKEIELIELLIKKRFWTFKTKFKLITELIDDGLLPSAFYAAKQMKNKHIKYQLLLMITEKQAKAPVIKRKILEVKQIYNMYNRSNVLADIAEQQAKSGDSIGTKTTFELAITTAREINNMHSRSEAFAYIAEQQAKSGDNTSVNTTFKLALSTARQVNNMYNRSNVLADIAEQQTKSGDNTGANTTFVLAITTARQVNNMYNRSNVLADIAEQQTKSGDNTGASTTFELAITTARQVDNMHSRSKAFAYIAEKQAKRGDNTGTNTTFELALSTARQVDNMHSRFKAFAYIAKKQAKSGDNTGASTTFELAITTAREVNNMHSRSEAFAYIARKQAETGLFTDALATVNQISIRYYRSEAKQIIRKIQQRTH